MFRLITVFYISLLFVVIWSTEFRQEGAKLKYVNPKYMTNMSTITRRISRHGPYRTNLTGTILVPFGNNVTFALILQLKNGGDFRIQEKVCVTLKTKWMQKYLLQFTNLPVDKCPIPVGWYGYFNMELPPRNIPMPTLDGDYYSIMELFITSTKEKIMSGSTLLHFESHGKADAKDDAKSDSKSDSKTGKDKDRNKNKKG